MLKEIQTKYTYFFGYCGLGHVSTDVLPGCMLMCEWMPFQNAVVPTPTVCNNTNLCSVFVLQEPNGNDVKTTW